MWLIRCQIKIDSASCIGSILPHYSRLSFFFFVHLLPISSVDKPAGELIVTYMDLIILSTAFGGLAFSDPWLIVVVIFQSLTAPHMLQTNPTTPTKAPVASGPHSSLKARRPVPLPSSPLYSHQYGAPDLWGRRGGRQSWLPAGYDCLEGRSPLKGRRGGGRKLKLHLGRGWRGSSPPGVSPTEGVRGAERPSPRCGWLRDRHGNGRASSAAAAAAPLPPCQAGHGCAGGTGPAPGEPSGWWRHCSNHLVHTGEPGRISPFASADSGNYTHLTGNQKASREPLSCFKAK